MHIWEYKCSSFRRDIISIKLFMVYLSDEDIIKLVYVNRYQVILDKLRWVSSSNKCWSYDIFHF